MMFDPGPVDIPAPKGALAWAPESGFIFDADELVELHGDGLLILDVENGVVYDVEGETPLAVSIRQDQQIAKLRAYVEDLYTRTVGAFEDAVQRMSEQD